MCWAGVSSHQVNVGAVAEMCPASYFESVIIQNDPYLIYPFLARFDQCNIRLGYLQRFFSEGCLWFARSGDNVGPVVLPHVIRDRVRNRHGIVVKDKLPLGGYPAG